MQNPNTLDLFATATEAQIVRLTRASFSAARRKHGTDAFAVAHEAGAYLVGVLDARDKRQRNKLAATLMRDE